MYTPSVSNLQRQLPPSLPPLVTEHSKLRKHVVTAASLPLPELYSFFQPKFVSLSKAAIDRKDMSARGSSGISRGLIRRYSTKGSRCTRSIAGFLDMTTAFLEAGMQWDPFFHSLPVWGILESVSVVKDNAI